MANPAPEIDQASIVLLGRFNPGIFQPAWFAAHELIRREEAENAKGLVFSPELAAFTADWLVLQVTGERFEASTPNTAHAAPLRDLVLSTFRLLPHTPLEKMGLNRHLHYRVEAERLNRLGDKLSPKQPWTSLLENPGLRSLSMLGRRPEAGNAAVQVVVEPSVKIRPGLYLATNQHYETSVGAGGGRELMELLETHWDRSQSFAQSVAEHLLRQD